MTATPRFPASGADTTKLASPLHFEFANRDAPNRFLKAAMTERLSTWDMENPEKRGIPDGEMQKLYKTWGEGRVGLLMTGNVMLDYDYVVTAGDPVVSLKDSHEGPRFEAFKELARQGKRHGSLMIAQINHPGTAADKRVQQNPVSSSDSPAQRTALGFDAAAARAASAEDLHSIVEKFAHTAEYLEAAGFDGVELHAAHGYLIAQFLSTAINKRTDGYGGSFGNRARLLREVLQAIRKRTKPSFILGVKLNSVEFQSSGLAFEEAKELCALLEASQVDFVELSGGSLESFSHKRESTKKREGFFMEFADLITPLFKKTKVFVTGGFKTVDGMARAVQNVDGVGLARPLAQEPLLFKKILEGEVTGAIQQRADEGNYGLTNMIAGAQLKRIALGLEPLDMSQQENEETFGKAMDKWTKESNENTYAPPYGFPSII